ncbi:MAG: RnfABCDGE type electron transport complex subunit G [Muribaculaceae bacterium]|nr:RnfABCDGE type electron transport complex subunit G [Muribaculaceae bacterium]
MKSTLRNMVLSLTTLTALAGGALAAVNLLTAAPIEEASRKARIEAMAAILPPFDNDIAAAATTLPDGLTLYPATMGGEPVGAAVESFTDNGFSGRFTILAGFDQEGRLTGYRVLEHSETPGLGAKMGQWFATDPHSIVGSSNILAVKGEGGNRDADSGASTPIAAGATEVDAITGATITSRAFLEAVNKARAAYSNYKNDRQ